MMKPDEVMQDYSGHHNRLTSSDDPLVASGGAIAQKMQKGAIYTCPMHPEIQQPERI